MEKGVEMRTIILTISVLLMLSCVTNLKGNSPIEGRTVFYVSVKDGNDKNPGTEELPWKTIGKAASTLKPGQKVLIKEGIYKEVVKPGTSGLEGSPIIYEAFPGDKVVIDGAFMESKNNFQDAVFKIESKKYITVKGLSVKNSAGSGIFAINSENIVFQGNSTENTWSSGISAFFGKNIVIDNNLVVLACNDGNQECISVAGVDGFEIKNNHVRDSGPGIIGGEGIDAKDGSRNGSIHHNLVHDINRLGIYVDSWAHHTYNIEVYSNTVFNNNSWGICLATENGGLLEDIRVYNNIVYDNIHVGIGIEGDEGWGVPGAKRPFKNIQVYNNTVHNNGSNFWGIGVRINCKDANGIYIRNNIFTMNESNQILIEENGLPENLVIENNLIYGIDTITLNSEEVESSFLGSGTIVISPEDIELEGIYKNPKNNNFRLVEGVNAIDSGSDTQYPSLDFDGKERGQLIDIGAFEYQ